MELLNCHSFPGLMRVYSLSIGQLHLTSIGYYSVYNSGGSVARQCVTVSSKVIVLVDRFVNCLLFSSVVN